MNPSGNTILITGGTSGIGRALAERLHDTGNTVIIAGRRRALLDEISASRPGIAGYEADMDDPQAISRLANQLVADHPALNVIIANAGIMNAEDPTARRELSPVEHMIATNLLGPIRLIDAFIDHLKSRPDAAIVTVTSGLAFVPQPYAPTYSATKAAIHSYTQSLRHLLAGQIEVIELAPPAVRTDLTPGQATRESFMPLADFADEVMDLLARQPTPGEILVERVKGLRYAEAEGRTEAMLAMLAEGYRQSMPA